VIDLDLEKFFDRVNHDKLMGRIAKAVVEAHSGIPECRGDGERTGQPERGRNSARRTSFATAE
jgi:hypothetical protein